MSPWERRERGGLYYTRSRKVDGRVVREYVGCGQLAELVAQMDALEREERRERAVLWKMERAEHEALAASVQELSEASDLIVRAALVAAGYHQHNRGEWRKRREPKETS